MQDNSMSVPELGARQIKRNLTIRAKIVPISRPPTTET